MSGGRTAGIVTMAGDRPARVAQTVHTTEVTTARTAHTNDTSPPVATGVRSEGKWPTHCAKCRVHVPQAVDAALCVVPRCRYMMCSACWDLEKDLVCVEHTTRVTTVQTTRGTATIVAAVDPIRLPVPQGASEGLATLIDAASVMLATIPDGSADAMNRALRNFRNFVRFFNVEWTDVTANVVAAYIVARCAPPIGVTLPEWILRPVEISTVGTELSGLRRWARMTGDTSFLSALTDDVVFRVIRHLSGGTRRAKTTKKPILVSHLYTLFKQGMGKAPHGTMRDSEERFWRDMTLLTVGLLAGLRRREIAGLEWQDVQWDTKLKELRIAVRRDKTNQNILNTQHPRVVVIAHELLEMCWSRFAKVRGGADGPLFRVCGTDRGIADATVATIVRERLPDLGVSPHSLRVGCATELFAAGVPPAMIMEIGRWSSLTALMYVLPSADAMASATRSMGQGVSKVDRIVLQRALGTQAVAPRVRRLS